MSNEKSLFLHYTDLKGDVKSLRAKGGFSALFRFGDLGPKYSREYGIQVESHDNHRTNEEFLTMNISTLDGIVAIHLDYSSVEQLADQLEAAAKQAREIMNQQHFETTV